jgi:hypothetical protein
MPSVWYDNLPSADDIWIGGSKSQGGWQMSNLEDDRQVMRHFHWNFSDNFDSCLKEMFEYHDAESISMFVGHCSDQNATLGWHYDDYHVWAFNIEGVTEWEWFQTHTGKFESVVLEPGYILTMPLGMTHRVKMISEERTSISLITRYGATQTPIPKEREHE